jgi:amino acid transporter
VPILVVLIVCSLVFYLFYKIKSIRTSLPMEKKWLTGKSSMAIGLFVASFGINQLFLFQTTITFLVAAIFIIVGLLSIIGGYKMYHYYLPHAIDEAEAVANQPKG